MNQWMLLAVTASGRLRKTESILEDIVRLAEFRIFFYHFFLALRKWGVF